MYVSRVQTELINGLAMIHFTTQPFKLLLNSEPQIAVVKNLWVMHTQPRVAQSSNSGCSLSPRQQYQGRP